MSLILVILQVSLILFSWIVNAVYPAFPFRSMISSAGIRWFIGNFSSMILTPALSWILLCSIAWGAFEKSGLLAILVSFICKRGLSYRQKHALFAVAGVLLFFTIAMLLLTCVPHATLLGITGTLFPSPFSAGIIPFSAFVLMIASVTYGLVSGNMADLYSIFIGISFGIRKFSVIFPVYVLTIQFYYSLKYVLMFPV